MFADAPVLYWRSARQRQVRLAYFRPDDTLPIAPLGWVHGGFHDRNLLWSAAQPSRITAVSDWDRIRLGSLAAEVVRTATLVFGYDSHLTCGRWTWSG